MKYFFCFQITFDVCPYVFRRLSKNSCKTCIRSVLRRLGCKDIIMLNNKKRENMLQNLEVSKIFPTFATSKGEFAERMTTFMAFRGRFEPQSYEPSLFGADGFVLHGNLRNMSYWCGIFLFFTKRIKKK